MRELEKLKEDLAKYCEGKLVVLYEVGETDSFDTSEGVEFSGGDYKDFLRIAERLGVKIVYYFEAFGETKEDEIAEIDLGFVYDGVRHTLSSYASWYEKELEENQGMNEEEVSEEFDKKSAEDLAKELVTFAHKEYPDALLNDMYHIADVFWQAKGFERITKDASTRIKMDKVKRLAEQEIRNAVVKKEKEELPRIIEECVAWARDNGFNKLTEGNLQAFLLEKSLDLSYITQNIIYVKVNFELKK